MHRYVFASSYKFHYKESLSGHCFPSFIVKTLLKYLKPRVNGVFNVNKYSDFYFPLFLSLKIEFGKCKSVVGR